MRPWPWADTWPVARLRAPDHDVDLIVLEDASGRTLAFAPGRVLASAPVGSAGHIVVGGHRDTHFAFLRDLAPGQRLILEDAARRLHRYVVREHRVVHERDSTILDARGEAALTLVTCWPFDSPVPGGPLRYAVIATLEGG